MENQENNSQENQTINSVDQSSKNSSKKSKLFWIIFIVISIIILGIIGFFTWKYYSEKSIDTNVLNQDEINKSKDNDSEKSNSSSSNQSSSCKSTLTQSDLTQMEGWLKYSSAKNSFTFQYPTGMELTTDEANSAVVKQTTERWGFEIYSGDFAFQNGDIAGYSKTDSKSTTISCTNAIQTYKSGTGTLATSRLIYSDFTKNNVKYRIVLYYQSAGASIDGDILDAYNLMLKSFTIK